MKSLTLADRVTLILFISASVQGSANCFGLEFNGRFGQLQRVSEIDSPHRDLHASGSDDGLTLFFASDRANPADDADWTQMDIWMATRTSTSMAFNTPTRLPHSVNQPNVGEFRPTISSDKLRLYFSTGSGPGSGDGKIWISDRSTVEAEWSTPALLEGPINDMTETENVAGVLSPDERKILFISAFEGSQDYDLFEARRPRVDEPFADITPLAGVNTAIAEADPTMSSNGLFLLYSSPRGPAGFDELWGATRNSVDEPFVPLSFNEFGIGNLNSDETAEFSPYLSPDWPAHGSKVYYSRASVGNDWDIYEATWLTDGCEPPNSLIGDIDGDGVVGFADFLVLSANFGTSGEVDYQRGDLDCNGDVNFSDFLSLSANFGRNRAASLQSVPEPENSISHLLAVYGIAMCLRRARGRS